MRRWATPLFLAVVVLAATALAVRQPPAPRSRLAGLDVPAAPVLSVRRAPDLLTRTIADLKLAAELDGAVGASASCLVVQTADPARRTLYARNPDQPLIPASNLKLLTALAALQELGPETTFVTMAKGTMRNGTIEGDLFLVGGGDPLLETADYAPTRRFPTAIRTPFERLADDLVAKGLTRIAGGIKGDESRYDAQRHIPSWPDRFLTQGQVGSLSALVVNDGFVQFRPTPARTSDPAAHAAALLTELLKSRGVSVGGAPGQSRAPASAASISELRSPPVREIVAEMLKESDNTTAELLVKELGYRLKGAGTTAAGLEAMRTELALPPAVHLVDGSGLDRADRATCNAIVAAVAATPPDALATAATDGTMTDRFVGHIGAGRIKAKTGSLLGVASLSGYADADLAFAFLVNDTTDAAGRALQERVGAALVRYPDAPAPDDVAP